MQSSDERASSLPGVDTSPTTLAQELLVACKRGQGTGEYEVALAELTETELRRVREDRATALAFWEGVIERLAHQRAG